MIIISKIINKPIQNHKTTFSTLTKFYSPIQRICPSTIQTNVLKNMSSKKFINNILIGINCTSIALKYVIISYNFYISQNATYASFHSQIVINIKLSPATIRYVNNMQFLDNTIKQMNIYLYKDFPQEMKFVRKLGKYFKYQNKNTFSSASLLFIQDSINKKNHETLLKFITAIESITLGFQLHHNIGTNYRPNTLVDLGLKIIKKVIKDKYLVLAGDYFHIKASVLGGQTKNIQISKLLAQMQINLCKYVHLKQQLNIKIQKQGYQSVKLQEIYEINKKQAKQITQSLIGMDMIMNRNIQNKHSQQQLYNCISLMILYRKQLQGFMFNFYKILGKYLQYNKKLKMNFCDQYTLSSYLFYQSAQKTQRIDLAYLNTVQMMNKQIQHLQDKLKQIIGKQYNTVKKRINYIMMIHS